MENTVKVLFDDAQPQWYIASSDHWVGPLTAADVYEKVVSQEISWAHFVWKPGQSGWQRICDVKTFQAAVPVVPPKEVREEVKALASAPVVKKAAGRKALPPAPKAKAQSWYLYYNDSQLGPFSQEEVSRFLTIGKVHGRVHAWSDGMGNWDRLENIALFKEALADSKKAAGSSKSQAKEMRAAPRRPLVARILMADDASVNVAICRDISVGGMQVLMDQIPGKAGSRLKLNVSPARGKGHDPKANSSSIRPFVAEGVIVRILEDGRGFSFRFERLGADAKRTIEEYISTHS